MGGIRASTQASDTRALRETDIEHVVAPSEAHDSGLPEPDGDIEP